MRRQQQEQIHIKHPSGRVLRLDCKAYELFRFLSETFHRDTVIKSEYTNQPASVAYTFASLAFFWRYKLMSDSDFQFFGNLPLAEQYEIALRYTACCFELIKIPETTRQMLNQLDKMLKEHNENL